MNWKTFLSKREPIDDDYKKARDDAYACMPMYFYKLVKQMSTSNTKEVADKLKLQVKYELYKIEEKSKITFEEWSKTIANKIVEPIITKKRKRKKRKK